MKDFMTITYWRQGHPLLVESASDFYYVTLTRRLYATIRATEVGRQSTETWVAETAMTLAYYLEDVVSGLGFWNVFVTKYKALYGKNLPFYNTDGDDYYTDEINVQDVRFLLWMSVQNNKRETVVNPENPYLDELASILYRQLDREFEKAPINEDLLDALKNAGTYANLDSLSLVAMRMLGVTYLFRLFFAETERVVAFEVNSLLVPGTKLALRDYIVRFMQTFCKNTGILALRGIEWMAALLRFWGLEDVAVKVEQMECIPFAYYKLKSYDDEKIVLEGFDGKEYALLRDAFSSLTDQLMDVNKVCLTTLVRYEDKWTTAGAVSWYANIALFDHFRAVKLERERINKEVTAKVLEVNNGRPMLYFATWSEFLEWGKAHLEIGDDFKPSREMENGKCLVLFAHPDEGMTLVPNEARFIKDDGHNPNYNAAQARRGGLNLLVTPGGVSSRMLHYLLDNGMLPDAALPSAKDAEQGKKLLQENMDFIARFLRTVDY